VCVRHREGWCATRRKRIPDENDRAAGTGAATLCRYVVVLPWGYERRTPTCAACLLRMKEVKRDR